MCVCVCVCVYVHSCMHVCQDVCVHTLSNITSYHFYSSIVVEFVTHCIHHIIIKRQY